MWMLKNENHNKHIEAYCFGRGLKDYKGYILHISMDECEPKKDFQNISAKSYTECEGLVTRFRDGEAGNTLTMHWSLWCHVLRYTSWCWKWNFTIYVKVESIYLVFQSSLKIFLKLSSISQFLKN